eukprot:m51a1_g9743 hypothetical protein (203) ;mRNA; f:1570304-1571132
MKVLVLYAHPRGQSGLNGAILRIVADTLRDNHHSCTLRDLYSSRFDPLLSERDLRGIRTGDIAADVRDEQALVAEADAVVVVAPVWWVSVPAVLRGYIDRVFSAGFAYRRRRDGSVEGLLKGKRAVIVTTAGEPREVFQSKYEDALRVALDEGTFRFCGIEDVRHHYLYGVHAAPAEQMRLALQDLERKLQHDFRNTLKPAL